MEKQKDVSIMKSGGAGDSRVGSYSLIYVVKDATWDHGVVLPCDIIESLLWVCGPAATALCYHQRPGGHDWSGLLPGDMVMSESCAELVPPFT